MATLKYYIPLLLLLLPRPAAAQAQPCRDCPCIIARGEQLAEKGDYVNAIRQYNAAKECAPQRTAELNRRIEALFRQIEGLRQEAVAERDRAEKALARVEAAERKAKAEAERASAEAQRANAALQKLEKAFGDLTDIYVQRAKDFIFELHYDSAVVWATEASALQVQSRAPALDSLYFELAYFYNEAGQPDTAAAMTDSLLAWRGQSETWGKSEVYPAEERGRVGSRKSEGGSDQRESRTDEGGRDGKSEAESPQSTIQPFNHLTIQPSAPPSRSSLRTLLATLDTLRFAALEKRYYPHMIPIPGGTFQMGSEEREPDERPVHKVTLSPFEMAETETTWWQYHLYCRASGQALPQEPGWGRQGSHPVVNVSWYDAIAYANWVSRQRGKEKVYELNIPEAPNELDKMSITWTDSINWAASGFRLPTEAEWEYAAGNGSRHTLYSWGDDPPSGKKGGNVADETAKKQNPDWTIFEGYTDGFVNTAPVASFDPNDFGLYDMTGNVWEWCQDWYNSKYYERSDNAKNPKGPDSGSNRVLRGGSWEISQGGARCANRNYNTPDYRLHFFGFRLARPVE